MRKLLILASLAAIFGMGRAGGRGGDNTCNHTIC